MRRAFFTRPERSQIRARRVSPAQIGVMLVDVCDPLPAHPVYRADTRYASTAPVTINGVRPDFVPEPLPALHGEVLPRAEETQADRYHDIHVRTVSRLQATMPERATDVVGGLGGFDCGHDTPFCVYPHRNCKRAHGGRKL